MPAVELQFGIGGTKIIRHFDVAPRSGEIVQIRHEDEEFALLIDTVLHFEDSDGITMRYYAHGQMIIDLDVVLERQAERARDLFLS